MRLPIAAIVFALLSWQAAAEEPTEFHIQVPAGEAVAEASIDCASGVVYDDGVFVDFYGMNPAYVVMKFDLPSRTPALSRLVRKG